MKPVPVEQIQYQLEKGKGLVHIAVEDVFIGVGVIAGERRQDGQVAQVPLTGSLTFEMTSKEKQARLQIDRIRLIERTDAGDGRIFEPEWIYDESMEKGAAPEIEFPEGQGRFPFVWENGKSGYVYFVFSDIPDNVQNADIVITYNGKFPEKKHILYYEDRISVKRKTYLPQL